MSKRQEALLVPRRFEKRSCVAEGQIPGDAGECAERRDGGAEEAVASAE